MFKVKQGVIKHDDKIVVFNTTHEAEKTWIESVVTTEFPMCTMSMEWYDSEDQDVGSIYYPANVVDKRHLKEIENNLINSLISGCFVYDDEDGIWITGGSTDSLVLAFPALEQRNN